MCWIRAFLLPYFMEKKKKKKKNGLGKVSAKVNGTVHGGQLGETIDGLELSVVGDLIGPTDALEVGHRDVGQGLIGDEDEGTAGSGHGQIGGNEGLEEVVEESHGSIDGGQRRQSDVAAVAKGHVVGPLQVGEGGDEILAVGLQGQGLGDVAQLGLDLGQVGVVGDVEDLDLLQIDAIERFEVGVGDADPGRTRDLAGEGQFAEGGEGGPPDATDGEERREVQVGQDGETGQIEGLVDHGQLRRLDAVEVDSIMADQRTLDALDTRETNRPGCILRDDEIAREDGTVGQDHGVTVVLNGVGRGITAILACDVVSFRHQLGSSWSRSSLASNGEIKQTSWRTIIHLPRAVPQTSKVGTRYLEPNIVTHVPD